MALEVRRSAQGLTLELTGEWGAQQLTALEAQLAAVDVGAAQQVQIATSGVTRLELSGAWVLREFVRRARAAGAVVSFNDGPPDQLRLLDETLKEAEESTAAPPAAAAAGPEASGTLASLGRRAVNAARDLI